MRNFIKAAVVATIASPVLFLTWQKLISVYIETLWPEYYTDNYNSMETAAFPAFFCVVSSLCVGYLVGRLYNDSKKNGEI